MDSFNNNIQEMMDFLESNNSIPSPTIDPNFFDFENFDNIFESSSREPWCLGPNTMAPVAKKQPPSTLSSTDGAWSFFKKYLKTLYGNLIGLNKGYKYMYLFPNLVSGLLIYINPQVGSFFLKFLTFRRWCLVKSYKVFRIFVYIIYLYQLVVYIGKIFPDLVSALL